jgi:hypothetical protein
MYRDPRLLNTLLLTLAGLRLKERQVHPERLDDQNSVWLQVEYVDMRTRERTPGPRYRYPRPEGR